MRCECGIEVERVDFVDFEASGSCCQDLRVFAVSAGNGFVANGVFPLGTEGLDDEFGDVGLANAGIGSGDKEIHVWAESLQWACGSSAEGSLEAFSFRR